MKRIAVIAFNHTESTLPLTKYLLKVGNNVDYFLFSRIIMKSAAAFNFGGLIVRPGVKKLTSRRIKDLYNYMEEKDVSINIIGLLPFRFGKINKRIVRKLGLKINDSNYDIVNIIGQHDMLIDLHSSIHNKKKIHTLHEVIDHYTGINKYNRLLTYLFENEIKIIVHSQTTYNQLIKYTQSKKDLVRIIPFGLFETYLLYDKAIKLKWNNKNTILFFGTLKPYKGLPLLIKAVDFIKKKSNINFNVVIAGDGDLPCKSKLIHDSTYIIINRYLTNEEIVALNKAAKFIVCPYISASQSGIIMTTFLFGKPIIASDVGALGEIIVNEYNGFLVPPNSSEILADYIIKLMNDNNLYLTLCENVKKFANSDRFNWKNIVSSTIDTYFDH